MRMKSSLPKTGEILASDKLSRHRELNREWMRRFRENERLKKQKLERQRFLRTHCRWCTMLKNSEYHQKYPCDSFKKYLKVHAEKAESKNID